MKQQHLFTAPALTPAVRREDPPESHESNRRLSRSGRRRTQIGAILERLRAGPATNVELADICLKYTGRISDLRGLGFGVQCQRQTDAGTTVYVLTEDPGGEA